MRELLCNPLLSPEARVLLSILLRGGMASAQEVYHDTCRMLGWRGLLSLLSRLEAAGMLHRHDGGYRLTRPARRMVEELAGRMCKLLDGGRG